MGTQATPRSWWYTGNAADAYKLWLGDRMLFAECGGLGDDAEEFTALIVRAVNRDQHFDALVAALAWALPYAKEHAERGSQCCGAAEHSEAEGICAQCREHTGFDNPDLEHAQAALKAAGEATS